jgi:hypothetical protein
MAGFAASRLFLRALTREGTKEGVLFTLSAAKGSPAPPASEGELLVPAAGLRHPPFVRRGP